MSLAVCQENFLEESETETATVEKKPRASFLSNWWNSFTSKDFWEDKVNTARNTIVDMSKRAKKTVVKMTKKIQKKIRGDKGDKKEQAAEKPVEPKVEEAPMPDPDAELDEEATEVAPPKKAETQKPGMMRMNRAMEKLKSGWEWFTGQFTKEKI